MIEWTLMRRFLKPTYTIGRFIIDHQRFCDTLEDRVRDLNDYNHDGDFDDPGEGKVYGQTAIPCGRYRVRVTWSPKFNRRLPIIQGVPGYTGIRIHDGVNEHYTEGCVLVGDNISKGRLTNGPYYVTKIIQMIDEHELNNEHVYLTIKENAFS